MTDVSVLSNLYHSLKILPQTANVQTNSNKKTPTAFVDRNLKSVVDLIRLVYFLFSPF